MYLETTYNVVKVIDFWHYSPPRVTNSRQLFNTGLTGQLVVYVRPNIAAKYRKSTLEKIEQTTKNGQFRDIGNTELKTENGDKQNEQTNTEN